MFKPKNMGHFPRSKPQNKIYLLKNISRKGALIFKLILNVHLKFSNHLIQDPKQNRTKKKTPNETDMYIKLLNKEFRH